MLDFIKDNFTLKNISSWSSIISFLLTIYVVYTIRSIKKMYKFKARIPELIQQLDEIKSEISVNFNEYESSLEDIQLLLGRAEILLKSIKSKLKYGDRSELDSCIDQIKNLPGVKIKNRDQVFEIYVELNKTIAVIEDLIQEYKWER